MDEIIGDRSDELRNRGLLKIISVLILLAILFIIIMFACSAGCITSAKNTYKNIVTTPTPTPTPNITVVENITIIPTPEPTPQLSKEQFMAQYNGMKQGQWLSWNRLNVSGYKDITVHTTVYDWRQYGIINWWSVSWGKYFVEGAGEGNKFLFVFVSTYTDEGSARMYGIDQYHYYAQIGNQLYAPSDKLLPAIRIKEFDEVWDRRHVENIKPYGYIRITSWKGEEEAQELEYLKEGYSNMWNGYIVYEIPANVDPKDVRIIGQFNAFTEPHWWQLE